MYWYTVHKPGQQNFIFAQYPNVSIKSTSIMYWYTVHKPGQQNVIFAQYPNVSIKSTSIMYWYTVHKIVSLSRRVLVKAIFYRDVEINQSDQQNHFRNGNDR